MKKLLVTVNGIKYDVEVEEVGGQKTVTAPAMRATMAAPRRTAQQVVNTTQQPNITTGSVVAPMPGTILKLKVSQGQEVKKGQVLLILEAMKMENEITAPIDGKVAAIYVEVGKSVSAREVMVHIE